MSLVDKIVKRIVLTSFFGDGWGEQETFHKLLQLRTCYKEGYRSSYHDTSNSEFQLVEESATKHVRSYTGSFISPAYQDHGLIPHECRTCKFQLVLPAQWGPEERGRVCLHYAATGDHSFWRRYRFLAYPLAREYNIGSIIVENPFYGTRKPSNQVRSGIRHVSDLFTMGSALILEGGYLLDWLESEGYTRLGISGISLGGHNASLTSAVWGKPIATVPCLSWSTAAHTFSEGIISNACMWSVLRDQLSPSKLEEIRDVVRVTDKEIQVMLQERYGDMLEQAAPPAALSRIQNSHVARLLNIQYLSMLTSSLGSRNGSPDKITTLYMRLLIDEFSNLKNYPIVACPQAAVVVVAKSDLYITRPEDDDMIDDISEIWPGCEVRVVDGGHISSYLTHNHSFRRAINDAFDKLDTRMENTVTVN